VPRLASLSGCFWDFKGEKESLLKWQAMSRQLALSRLEKHGKVKNSKIGRQSFRFLATYV